MKNMSVAGGAVADFRALGAGPWSVDAAKSHSPRQSSAYA